MEIILNDCNSSPISYHIVMPWNEVEANVILLTRTGQFNGGGSMIKGENI